jgi:hypothetical protein
MFERHLRSPVLNDEVRDDHQRAEPNRSTENDQDKVAEFPHFLSAWIATGCGLPAIGIIS